VSLIETRVKMASIMFIELWEWLRGYDKWLPAQATVEYVKEGHTYREASGKELHYSYTTGERLVWTDAHGQKCTAPLKPPSKDPEYQFSEGETAAIRYNPAKPDEYYFRKLTTMRVRYFFVTAFAVIAVAAFCIGDIWVRQMLGCSR
jgi:hypothetical protein